MAEGGEQLGQDAIAAEIHRRFDARNAGRAVDSAFGLIDPLQVEALEMWDLGNTWLITSLGLTRIWDEGPDPRTGMSGLGFEYTLRIPKSRTKTPPSWAATLMNQLCRAALGGDAPGAGHTLDPHGAIDGSRFGRMRALCFASDPDLSTIDTPNGRVEFVRVIGIRESELRQLSARRTQIADLTADRTRFITQP